MSKPWSKNIVLDPGTFGRTKACHVLVEMMNNNVISAFEKHKVLALIHDAIRKFQGVATIKNYAIKHQAMTLMKDYYINRIDQMSYPDKFISFLRNVLHYQFRKALR